MSIRKVRIFLAWQTIADGRRQIRKWSPDINRFFGYQKQDVYSLDWLKWNGNPEWGNLTNDYTEKAFDIIEIETI